MDAATLPRRPLSAAESVAVAGTRQQCAVHLGRAVSWFRSGFGVAAAAGLKLSGHQSSAGARHVLFSRSGRSAQHRRAADA